MNMEAFALGILTIVFLGSNIFWAKLVLDLTNRLMSRTYTDVVLAENLNKTKNEAPNILLQKDNEQDLYATEQANKLNALVGII